MDDESIACDMYADISGVDCTAASSKLVEALEALAPGKVLMAVARTDALQCDLPDYCRQMNLELVNQGEDEQQFYFLIRK
ncbi:MAG: sulfurtransferase TusA family protein [Gammaproteobacteria bacterium]|jgi:TusA-related sulfurtransferase|nr:sulfurtransferase TusA family protein [Gammaproteobacteria bacterium]